LQRSSVVFRSVMMVKYSQRLPVHLTLTSGAGLGQERSNSLDQVWAGTDVGLLSESLVRP